MNNEEIIKKLSLNMIKVTGEDLMKIIQEDGANGLADDLNGIKDNVHYRLNEMLNEARADERNRLSDEHLALMRKVIAKEIFNELDDGFVVRYKKNDDGTIGEEGYYIPFKFIRLLKTRMGIE